MNSIATTLVQGHQVASGLGLDPRFPGGTIRMQIPAFLERGFDLTRFYPATLNLSTGSTGFQLGKPDHTFQGVSWHPKEPAEDFSFFSCEVRSEGSPGWCDGWIYYPHPETKPEHFQPANLLEVLVERRIPGLVYGCRVELRVDPARVAFLPEAEGRQG